MSTAFLPARRPVCPPAAPILSYDRNTVAAMADTATTLRPPGAPESGRPGSASHSGTPGFDPGATLARLAEVPGRGVLRHVEELPRREADPAPWPEWVAPTVYSAFASAGITELWSHQA